MDCIRACMAWGRCCFGVLRICSMTAGGNPCQLPWLESPDPGTGIVLRPDCCACCPPYAVMQWLDTMSNTYTTAFSCMHWKCALKSTHCGDMHWLIQQTQQEAVSLACDSSWKMAAHSYTYSKRQDQSSICCLNPCVNDNCMNDN